MKDTIKEEYEQLIEGNFHNYIENIYNRYKLVIKAKGGIESNNNIVNFWISILFISFLNFEGLSYVVLFLCYDITVT